VFSHGGYRNMNFVYWFCNDNGRTVVEEYWKRFPEGGIPPKDVFSRAHYKMRENGPLSNASAQSERDAVPLMTMRQNILEMV
jgi:hypothetical protein